MFMNTCTNERPLIACTACLVQHLYDQLIYQRWWPTYGKEEQKRSLRNKALEAVEHATEGSCLAEKMMAPEEYAETDLQYAEHPAFAHYERFEHMQCPSI